MIFAETSELVQIVNSVLALIAAMFAGYMTYLMAKLKADIKEVHNLANSMKDQLVETAHRAGVDQGGMEERARADKREGGKS